MGLRGLYCKYLAGHDYERIQTMPEKIYGRWYQCSVCRKCVVVGVDTPSGQPPTPRT